jgi:hypothetical protein
MLKADTTLVHIAFVQGVGSKYISTVHTKKRNDTNDSHKLTEEAGPRQKWLTS